MIQRMRKDKLLITSERFDVWNRDWHHLIAQNISVGVVDQHFSLGSIVCEILDRIHDNKPNLPRGGESCDRYRLEMQAVWIAIGWRCKRSGSL
jgi:hypothetical protein